ncbi:MAG: hypothetical protein IJP68_01020 [Selenomonadaceae bacterium]|nr:hypothetical protein [Selenomonadaceae bacterium]
MPDNQNVSIWDNPMYAWQQQLASGANLAKNLNWQTLLGLTLGTGIGHWLGDKFYNWQREGDDAHQYGKPNPVAINAAIRDYLLPQGEFDLGWKPQYQFPTANKLFTDAVTPKPSSFDWRQNLRRQQPFFQMTPTPTAPAAPTTPSTTANPWGNTPHNFGGQLGQRYF